MMTLPSLIWPMILVLVAGGMVALQAPTNAMLAKAGGSPILAALLSFAVGVVVLVTILLASGHRTSANAFASLPWYAWLGGVYGAVYVAAAAFAAPKIGLASFITIGIAGQLLTALWLDHSGSLGLDREPISLVRVGGVLMVLAGVFLVRRSA